MEPSSRIFAQTWANLYSPVIMAFVGGYTSGRSNFLEQVRTPLLVVKVLVPALVFMIFCCVLYICAGCVLALFAIQTSSEAYIRDAVARLGIFGVVDWAASATDEEEVETLTNEQKLGHELSQIGLMANPVNGYHFESTRIDDNNSSGYRLGV